MIAFMLKILSGVYFFALHIASGGSFPAPLSEKKERELLTLAQSGDKAAKDKLIEHNLRLVAHVVKKYYAQNCEPDDLISIGTIGLIKAVYTFNADKGIRLATYAARCIENEILMYFRNTKKQSQDVFMNEPVDCDSEGNAISLIDTIADDFDIVEEIDKKMKLKKLPAIINETLNEREKQIINMRYGINGYEELTQREIAKKLSISRSYVSRIEKSALLKLEEKL